MATDMNDRNKPRTEDPAPVVTETAVAARQGVLGQPVLMVLIGGLVLAIVAWGVSEMYGESIDDQAEPASQTDSVAPNAEVTPENQGVIDNNPPSGERMQPAPTDQDPTPQTGTGGASQSVAPTGTETRP